ncbi:hypothetical protein [Acinetobacter dispersus]|uniref:hypothetical protein n=1 Tax=Acinetobacter dispersus TaxID=70348 RepID=UPI001F4B5BC9|nr:hypothetical protein [Acinetobacter dispersus]MCH7391843.1 hypothetical protein [Acinetobacter dispersus]
MKNGRPFDKDAFENRFQILVYAAHSNSFRVSDVALDVVNASNNAIRNYLKDLMQLGYVERHTIYDYRATDVAKGLFGVNVTTRDGEGR